MTDKAAKSGGNVLDFYSVAPRQPFADGQGTRYLPKYSGAEGYREVLHIAPGLELVLGDVRHEREVQISHPESATLKFHFRLEGSGRVGFPGSAHALVEEHTFGVLLHPEGAIKTETFLAGQHEQSVTLLCSQRFVADQLGELAAEMPEPLSQYASGVEPDYYHLALPMRVEMMAAVRAVLGCELAGRLRRLYCESKALELFALCAETLRGHRIHGEEPGHGLTGRDLECLHAARAHLAGHFIDAPSIGELASQIGINEAKLMRGFKQLFGQTVFEYTQHLRMEAAKELLENSEQSITDIAFEVGYEYSSNFATAFRRHFGISPRAARQAGRR